MAELTEAERRSLEKFKLERRNPLPPGRYWQDIFPKQFAAFDEWLTKNRDSLDLLADEWFVAGSDKPGTRGEVNSNPVIRELVERRWVLFRVIEPVRWEGPGLPTIATDDIRASTNTEPRIDPKDFPSPDFGFGERAEELGKSVMWGLGGLLLAAVVANAVVGKVLAR